MRPQRNTKKPYKIAHEDTQSFPKINAYHTCFFKVNWYRISPEKDAYYIICYVLENVPSDYMLHTNVMQRTQKVRISNEHEFSILFVFWMYWFNSWCIYLGTFTKVNEQCSVLIKAVFFLKKEWKKTIVNIQITWIKFLLYLLFSL